MNILLVIIMLSPHFMLGKTLVLIGLLTLYAQNILIRINPNVIWLGFFGVIYELSIALNGSGEVGVNALTGIFFPPAIYLVGRFIGFKNSPEKITALIVVLGITMAFIPLISIWSEILTSGFDGSSRNITLLWGIAEETSATVLGGYLTASLCFVAVVWNRREPGLGLLKVAVLMTASLSFIAALRLGSRTQLIVFFAALTLGFLLNAKKISAGARIFWGVVVISAIFLFIYAFGSEVDLLVHFADRLGDENAGFDSAGGRTERWIAAFKMLIPEFFGWPMERIGYAHNIFLDVARAAGFIPAVVLLIAYIRLAVDANWVRTRFHGYSAFRVLAVSSFVGISLVFFVEPVLSGYYQLFTLFLLIGGIMSGIKSRFEASQRKRLILDGQGLNT